MVWFKEKLMETSIFIGKPMASDFDFPCKAKLRVVACTAPFTITTGASDATSWLQVGYRVGTKVFHCRTKRNGQMNYMNLENGGESNTTQTTSILRP